MLTVVILVFGAVACSRVESANEAETAHHKFVLVGSTACDAEIKAQLSIAAETKCDFIRWKLTLDRTRGETFALEANYGEAQPNTKGFIGGGQRISAVGKFISEAYTRHPDVGEGTNVAGTEATRNKSANEAIANNPAANRRRNKPATGASDGRTAVVYMLTSDAPSIRISILQVNDNIFHILTPGSVFNQDASLMVGNAGWSYTLNRAPAVASTSLPVSVAGGSELRQAVLEGRTPCKEIAEIVKLAAGPECFKIKWRIKMELDGTFAMDTTLNRQATIRGTWRETDGVYRFSQGFSLLVADENVVFFLDGNGRLLVGNEDFSYTLNAVRR